MTISDTFDRLRSQNRMAFIPFVTAGDPDMSTTLSLIRELAQRGADLIEVGFPYSDPIADGPVIQASYTRALDRGLHVSEIFEAIGTLKTADCPPLVAMVSYAIVFRNGPESFVSRAKQAGFSGFIVPDLPGDESQELARVVREQGLDLIQLIAPTTPEDRVDRILQAASGFIYCIAIAGITGERDEVSANLERQLKTLRSKTRLPLAVGFGISRPDHVAKLRGQADGVIVGSAIVRQLAALSDGSAGTDETLAKIGEFAQQMIAATKA